MAIVHHIPDDIITDILSRLPSASLLRFKTACKSWYTLISSPYFNLLSKRSSENTKILFTTEGKKFWLLDPETSNFDVSCLSDPFSFPPERSDPYLKILGSCCGLVCVSIYNFSPHYSALVFWNPLTREFRKIPNVPYHPLVSLAHGLGYDPVSNDFKLVLLKGETSCCVFSLKLSSWKTIAYPHRLKSFSKLDISIEIIVVHGVFHWLSKPKIGHNLEITAFDSIEEKFLDLATPSWSSYEAWLLEHKGRLCISFSKRQPETVEEIWMLKEHDWIRFLCINLQDRFLLFRGTTYVSNSSTQVMLRNTMIILRYSKEKGKFDEIRRHPFKFRWSTKYVETLISPNYSLGLHHRSGTPTE